MDCIIPVGRRDGECCGDFLDVASALTHSEGTGRRLSLARMVSGGLVQTKGFEDRLCSRMYWRMASSRSATDLKMPRRICLRVMIEKKPSTALSQDAEVGVKWKTQRG